MLKKFEIANKWSCLNKTHEDEPVFVLRGQDKLAPILVRLWASLAEQHGCGSGKVDDARTIAYLMDKWQENLSKFPD